MVTEGLILQGELLLLPLVPHLSQGYLKSINLQRSSQRHLLCCAELMDFYFLTAGVSFKVRSISRAACTHKVPKYLKLTKQCLLFCNENDRKVTSVY